MGQQPRLGAVEVALLVPVKRFGAAKQRLSSVLSADDRARFARWLGEHVLGVDPTMPRFVACDDDEVAAWADACGAEVLWTPGLGLNGAVDHGRATIAGKGIDHVVVAHSDLPLAESFRSLAREGSITLVPDRRLDGTNAVAMPATLDFHASYGAGSYRRHLAAAMATGLAVDVRFDPRLGLDVDTPNDLRHPLIAERLPSWLRTNPDNQRPTP